MTVDVSPSPKQKRAIASLAAGSSWADAALAAGISERTIFRWAQQPAFRQALAEAGNEQIEKAGRAMLSKLTRAIDVIGDMMTDQAVPAHVRLRAAQLCIEQSVALRDAVDAVQMRETLEQTQALMVLVAGIVAGDQDQ